VTTPGRALLPLVRNEWRALGVAGGSTVLVTAAELARPWPLALAIDYLLEEHAGRPFRLDSADVRAAIGFAGLLLLIAIVDAAAQYHSDVRMRAAGERILHTLRVRVYDHLQLLSLAFHERRHTGDLVTRVTGDAQAVGELFAQSLGRIVAAGLLLAGMVTVSVILDPVLAAVAFATVPLLGAATLRFRRLVKDITRRQRAKEGEIASVATEALSAMPVVKAHGSERLERERVARGSEERRRLGIEVSRLEGRFTGLIDVLGAVGAALVILVGVLRVGAGALSPGDLVVFSSYTRRAYRPLRELARELGRVARAMVRVERIAEILAADDVLPERPGAFAGGRARGEIELQHVSFAYDPDRPVLDDLTLRIEPGSRVAIVGPSGAGKSTLGALVARFYDPDRGRVLFDGRDARDCSLAWLRGQIGLVLQHTVLFTGTVAENIAYGTEATREQIVAAAKAAGAHAFVSELPENYDTPLGPRGVGLSGGQRQRIAIARALLRDPSVLVLDEPTTGLDAVSETQVMDGLRLLMRGRTTLLITHSPALARTADHVIVLECGRVKQQRVARRCTISAPRDPALPALARLLDTEAMASVLDRTLAPGSPPPDVRIEYLRYKPDTNLVAHYSVGVGGRRHDAVARISARANMAKPAARPENLALARKVDGRSPAPRALVYDPELDALLQWLPLDLSLPALAQRPEELAAALRRHGVEVPDDEPAILSYRPRRRAVLRLGDHVLKVYATEEDFRAAIQGLLAGPNLPTVPTARFEAALPRLRLTAQSLLGGSPTRHDHATLVATSVLLRDLHAARVDGLRARPPHAQLEAAAASARLAEALVPELSPRLARLVARLEATLPDAGPLVPSHGDFHARQVMSCEGELALIDFDEMCAAPAAFDLANYAAHLIRGAEGENDGSRTALDALVEGYGARPAGIDWYLSSAILRRTPFPFRYLDDHWPERVQAMTAAAEATLPERA
jgi:ATP-binding cassette, subfamily B, bacterial